MGYSKLVDHVDMLPHYTKTTAKKVGFTLHHMAGNLSVEGCGEVLRRAYASTNYGIDSDGRIGVYVDEDDRSWATTDYDNDSKHIQIELANDEYGGNWHVSETTIQACIKLMVDRCKELGIPHINYTGDKSGNLTMHCWYMATACPGPYLKSQFKRIADAVNAQLSASSAPAPTQNGMLYKVQVGAFKEKKNAVNLSAKLKDKGYATYLVSEGGYAKVQVGAYADKANADKMLARLAKDGFKGFITTTKQEQPAPKPAPALSLSTTLRVGDSVSVTNPYDENGTRLAVSGTYEVMEINGSRVVIGRGGVVTAAVPAGNLRKTGSAHVSAPAPTIRVGSRVRIRSRAKDLNTGYTFADFVYANTYSIIEISGNRVVFGIGSAVTGVVDKSNIRLA